jgi:hypothetical protein
VKSVCASLFLRGGIIYLDTLAVPEDHVLPHPRVGDGRVTNLHNDLEELGEVDLVLEGAALEAIQNRVLPKELLHLEHGAEFGGAQRQACRSGEVVDGDPNLGELLGDLETAQDAPVIRVVGEDLAGARREPSRSLTRARCQ